VKNKVEVYILGRKLKFQLTPDVDVGEFKEIIRYVENKFRFVKQQLPDTDSYKLSLLVAIHLAEEIFSLRRDNRKMNEFLNKIDRMIS
jgi:cell division protein ZapA (FtsZ GTPase activity inhibitor)